jgi:putative Mg2+ transporter-C (MgtC) family protein
MHDIYSDLFARYWGQQELTANLIAFANIMGALILGLIVGYERSYNGRAAGMRTYGLVCMASCALVVLAGSPTFWYGGNPGAILTGQVAADPTRIIQGVVTGIGFLGAGVIMKDGLNISGLTTSASLWASSAIGVLVGVGFYATAMLLTLLSAGLMMWAFRLEQWLPAKQAISITLRFHEGFRPEEIVLKRVALERGYDLIASTLNIHYKGNSQEWRFIAVAQDKENCVPITVLANELKDFEGVDEFHIAYARN